MSKASLVLSVVKLVVPEPPTVNGAIVELHGAGSEVATVNLMPARLLELSILFDQLALDIESARLLAKMAPLPWSGSATEASAPAVVPVHIAHTLSAVKMPEGGLLLDVKGLQGEDFRLAISAEQAATVLLSLCPPASRVAQ